MNITLASQGFDLSDAISEYVHMQAQSALHHHGESIRAVDVYLRDVGGARGPSEYNVVLYLSLHDLPGVVVEGNGCDLYVTSRYVATRAERALERALRQSRKFKPETVRRSPLLTV